MSEWSTDIESIPLDVDIVVRLSNDKYHIGKKNEYVFIIGERFSWDQHAITHWKVLDKVNINNGD